jgi:hypothetical protein
LAHLPVHLNGPERLLLKTNGKALRDVSSRMWAMFGASKNADERFQPHLFFLADRDYNSCARSPFSSPVLD